MSKAWKSWQGKSSSSGNPSPEFAPSFRSSAVPQFRSSAVPSRYGEERLFPKKQFSIRSSPFALRFDRPARSAAPKGFLFSRPTFAVPAACCVLRDPLSRMGRLGCFLPGPESRMPRPALFSTLRTHGSATGLATGQSAFAGRRIRCRFNNPERMSARKLPRNQQFASEDRFQIPKPTIATLKP